MSFEPIAIVGRACTLPEAATPEALWANVLAGKSCLSAAPADRWGLSRALAVGAGPDSRDRTWSDVGGYVRGFDQVFDPEGFALPAELILGLDPLFRWVLHGVRESLRAIGHRGAPDRAGLVLGNLSFPSAGMSRFAESVWMSKQSKGALPDASALPRPHAFNRFSSGLPAHLAARAMGLHGGAFAVDAACASSLYAIKLACDRLHDGSADLMVAGAVNGADDLFLHVGFSALSALSRSGQSRPFHRDADGLVPAEGAGFVVLKRLADAVRARDRILGVIRGVGLSNDGRGRGFLAPAEEGQVRAMRQAYAAAGLSPADITLLECHATGTVVGDATEIRSATALFAGQSGLPIGSLKSNLGHLITAAGVAALLKVLGAMEAGVRPPTLHADAPLDALAGTPLRLLSAAEPWTGPRRAGISAFGFGGNNAHLIVEAWEGEERAARAPSPKPRERVAIVGIGARVGQGDGARDFARDLFDGKTHQTARAEVSVALEGLRFPPKDLAQTLAQQLLILEAAREAAAGLTLPRERTSVLVGMGGDPEVARYGARWRVAGWAEQWAAAAGGSVDAVWLAEAREAFRPVLESAGVVGTMPNIVANRINGQLDLAGPSFSVSAEEASGTVALELCARALAAGEIDAALVGAVDLSHEAVHRTALEELDHARPAGDAAVVLVLERLADARANGHPVFAILDPEAASGLELGDAGLSLGDVFGSAHAASGLMHVAAAALALRHGAQPQKGAPAAPWLGERTARITTSPLQAPPSTLGLRGAELAPWLAEPVPVLHVFSGRDREGALTALAAGQESSDGLAKLVIVAADPAELSARAEQARAFVAGGGPPPEGVAFREAPIAGETAFVFTGDAAAYTGMGRELVLALPGLAESLAARSGELSSFLCELHAELTAKILKVVPQLALGDSSGESPAVDTLDFARVVEQAYADGVRVFVEHGPGGLCTGSIRRILAERDHVAVSLDAEGRCSVRQLMNAVAELVAAGVPVDVAALTRELALAAPPPRPTGAMLRIPAHPPAPRLPPFQATVQTMLPAPRLPPVMAEAPAAPELAPAVSGPPAAAAPPRAAPVVPALPAPRPPRELARPGMPARSASPMAHVLAGMSAHRAQLAGMHAEYIASQAAIHERFLALRQVMEANLLGGYRAAVQGVPFAPPPAALPGLPLPPPPAALPGLPLPPPPAARPLPSPSASAAPAPPVARALPGPKLSRADLEIMASGRISSVLGPEFEPQDGYARQVRMPEPPLLLADRVTGIEAVPLSMGTGTIWTETDVRADSWYLDDQGRMPAGVMIESGQADLLLIGYLGADMQNQGERVYRLLGCELTYHGGLPAPGDTLVYDIHVDGHAAQGDVRLFFFHYDCRVRGEPRLTVRHGQAGFFSDQELEESAGVLWDARTETPSDGPLDAPAAVCQKPRLSSDDLRAFADGRAFDCFGPGWERTRTHVRTPRITGGRMLFLDEVAELDPRGGPWGRGYLRAETLFSPDDWFFDGHFKNDPCMPGTLMFEGCLQAMAVYLAALGFTIDRDGWRFEPVPEEKYPMRCRGQATPSSRRLTYEVFVSELSAGPVPTVFADLLCTVDGRKAFHAKRVGLRLIPDWPLSHWRELGPHVEQETGTPLALRTLGGLSGHADPKPVAVVDGFAFGYDSLLSCAWGPPSEAFGPFYSRFDGTRRVARLPGPPYHFMSRVVQVDEPIGAMQKGLKTEIEYDVPSSVWYFEQSGYPTMPFAVLLEAALQPCGWLASYVGSALTTDVDLLFRNLDGVGTQLVELLPESGTLRTKVELTNISQSAGMIIESFKVQCLVDDLPVYDMTTVFGFFPKEAFDNQVGLPVTDVERARAEAPSDVCITLDGQPAKYCSGTLRLPGPMLLMLDRVTAWELDGGRAGLGYVRAEKDVDVDEWFFKAHFFQDPVQPGSLGIEALIQLLQFYILERGMGDGIANARFEPLMIGRPLTWKYRGQVVPKNERITTEIEITELGEDERGRYAICDGWLWVDGKRIYLAKNMGMRIVAGDPVVPRLAAPAEERLDPAVDRWLADHRPTWTVPALPMMSMVDRLVGAAERHGKRSVSALTDVRVHRWLPFPAGEIRLRTEVSGDGDELEVALLAWREAPDKALSRFEPVVTARAHFGARARVEAFAPLDDARPSADPYAAGSLFHGPAFQYMTSLRTGSAGASATLAAERGSVPRGTLHQGLLDAATHAIPHDALCQWTPEVSADQVAYPYRIPEIVFYAPLPAAGEVQVEARFAGFEGGERFPAVDLQMSAGGRVLVSLRLVEVLLPKGPIGQAPPADRAAFLRDRRFVAGLGLSSFDGTTTRLAEADVRQSDWLPGTVAGIYGLSPGQRGDTVTEIAVREHVARRAFVHPSALGVDADLAGATATIRPLRHHAVRVTREAGAVLVADAAPPAQDLGRVRDYWSARFGVGRWPVEDLYYGLIERFVGDVVVADPAAYAEVYGRSCLYLGNHQVGVESLLFSIIASALSGTPTVTLAKAEHRTSWLGELIAHSFSYPGVTDPKVITFFDREDRESLVKIIGELAGEMRRSNKSAMVHVEGTRALAGRQPVVKMSSAFIDMALDVGAPIVPIRFVGGLPLAELAARIEFPIGFGRQDYWIGKPILPEQLAALPYKDRKALVLAAMNGLGPVEETPTAPEPRFAALVDEWLERTGATPEHAVLFQTLAELQNPGEHVAALLEGARRGELRAGDDEPSRWLARLARWLFGPRGPRAVVAP